MAQSHIDQCVADLAVGAPLGHTPMLVDYGFTIPMLDQLLALPAGYGFKPQGSYCPQSDVPDNVHTVGVHLYAPGKCCIAIDNGMYLAVWLLEQQGA